MGSSEGELTAGPAGPVAPAGPGGPASPLAPASPGSPLAPGCPSVPYWNRNNIDGEEREMGTESQVILRDLISTFLCIPQINQFLSKLLISC